MKRIEFTLTEVKFLQDANWLVNGNLAYCAWDTSLKIEKLSKVDYVVSHQEEWNLHQKYGILSSVGTLARALFDAGRVYGQMN